MGTYEKTAGPYSPVERAVIWRGMLRSLASDIGVIIIDSPAYLGEREMQAEAMNALASFESVLDKHLDHGLSQPRKGDQSDGNR